MSFTYSGNPDSSPKDAVRYEVGDTFEKTQLLQDEEILYALKKEGTVLKAAARCAEALAARYAREENVRTATYTSNRGMVSQHYADLAKRLRGRGTTAGSFLCPSMTRSNKRENVMDSDLLMVESYKGMMKNPDAPADGNNSRNDFTEDKTSG